MKNITEYLITEAKFELPHISDYKFSWIDIKDRWATKGEACHKYQLVAIPNNNGDKPIKVFRDFAWYKSGYDQGHASSRKFYLVTSLGGERGNGHGIPKEEIPSDYDIELDAEMIADIISGKKSWSSRANDYAKDNILEFPVGTKLSEIKQKLN